VTRSNLIRHFPVFLAAAEEEHFHRAARRLGIAQSAVSRRISQLEEELGGVTLFERLPRGVRLTESGRTFLKDVQAIMNQVEKARRRLAEGRPGAPGVLNVGYNQAVPRHRFLAEAFRRFRQQFRGATLRLHPTDAAAQLAALASGELDAAFLYGVNETTELAGLDVFVEDFLLVMPGSHPLAARPVIALRELADEDFVWFRRSTAGVDLHDLLIAECERRGFSPRIVLETHGTDSIYQFVASGTGVGFAPSSSAAMAPPNVVLRPLADFSVPFTLRLVWPRENNSPLLAAFVKLVRECREEAEYSEKDEMSGAN
jgi:DNA-binding transcriptional LysR family regulator